MGPLRKPLDMIISDSASAMKKRGQDTVPRARGAMDRMAKNGVSGGN